jgi:hypothetical protein
MQIKITPHNIPTIMGMEGAKTKGENWGNGNFRREVSRRETGVNLYRRMMCFSKSVSL